MVNSDWLFVIPLSFPLIAAVAGVLTRETERPHRQVLLAAVAAAIFVAALAADTHAHGVSTEDYLTGMVAAGLVLGGLPVCAYFVLGRGLSSHPVVLGAIVVLTAPLVLYFVYFFGWLVTLSLTHCPPDAYECPL